MHLFTLARSFRPAILLAFAVSCQAESTSSGSITADTFVESPPANVLVLDVRSRSEFASGHIENALNIPHDELSSRVSELTGTSDRPIVVYCERGGRAGMAAGDLTDAGFTNVLHLEGDMSEWRAKGRKIDVP